MRYNIYKNNHINYSEYKMGNSYRFIIDNFDMLLMCYSGTSPSKILSKDSAVIGKFRRKVLRRVTEYATKDLQ